MADKSLVGGRERVDELSLSGIWGPLFEGVESKRPNPVVIVRSRRWHSEDSMTQ